MVSIDSGYFVLQVCTHACIKIRWPNNILDVVCFIVKINYGNVITLFTLHYHMKFHVSQCSKNITSTFLCVMVYVCMYTIVHYYGNHVWRFYCCTKITCVSVSFSVINCSLFLLWYAGALFTNNGVLLLLLL